MVVRLRILAPALLIGGVIVGAMALAVGFGTGVVTPPGASPTAPVSGNASAEPPTLEPTIAPTPTPRPVAGGTELYGFLPYWQMTETMATYLKTTPLTTVALFSVTARKNGSISTSPAGYKRITGAIGRRLIEDAHARFARVDVVFTSFGPARNAAFFGRTGKSPAPSPSLPGALGSPGTSASAATPPPPPWQRTVGDLVDLVTRLGIDGVSVDVEQLDEQDRGAYGDFLRTLRSALLEANPHAQVTVATEAGPRGVGNAAAASQAGVDRVFMMGYDYHWSGSQPGASAPIDRNDGSAYTLRWSIDAYVEAGVPRDHILLGLPLYGMKWRTEGPERTTPVIGSGVTWVPNHHLDELLDPAYHPGRDPLEVSEVVWVPDGLEWLVTYYDSPATLRPKLALAVDNGLAGAGFWAMGYERGLPGYVPLMLAFREGSIDRCEAPPRP
jgi:hypothetical protein